jgi:hypothetical protein
MNGPFKAGQNVNLNFTDGGLKQKLASIGEKNIGRQSSLRLAQTLLGDAV